MRPHELRLPHPAGPGQRQTDERHVFPGRKAGFRLVRARKRRKAHAGPAVAELGNGHGAGYRAAGMASRRTERHPYRRRRGQSRASGTVVYDPGNP